MKIIVIVLLLLIVASLGSALFFLVTDKSGSTRTARALTVRISLSLLLFAILVAGYYFGVIGNK
ncbi:MAG: twin transmembrane helix small protein [Proteobacteria bacterium]|nr:twin transmembrane helix small protein [Pseudomonadota bacterium]